MSKELLKGEWEFLSWHEEGGQFRKDAWMCKSKGARHVTGEALGNYKALDIGDQTPCLNPLMMRGMG